MKYLISNTFYYLNKREKKVIKKNYFFFFFFLTNFLKRKQYVWPGFYGIYVMFAYKILWNFMFYNVIKSNFPFFFSSS